MKEGDKQIQNEEYNEYVKQVTPTNNLFGNMVKAFIVGGLICAAVQILLDRTKLMPGRVMVLLVCGGALLGFCGLYDPFQKLAGAGAGVPLPGFGNVLWQGVKEAVDKYGFMGVFMGGFQASAVGISAALIFGYIASFIFEPKMKK